jgi:hypothetical protein
MHLPRSAMTAPAPFCLWPFGGLFPPPRPPPASGPLRNIHTMALMACDRPLSPPTTTVTLMHAFLQPASGVRFPDGRTVVTEGKNDPVVSSLHRSHKRTGQRQLVGTALPWWSWGWSRRGSGGALLSHRMDGSAVPPSSRNAPFPCQVVQLVSPWARSSFGRSPIMGPTVTLST